MEDKFLYCKAQIRSRGFSSRNENERKQIYTFFEKHSCWTSTAIVKISSISWLFFGTISHKKWNLFHKCSFQTDEKNQRQIFHGLQPLAISSKSSMFDWVLNTPLRMDVGNDYRLLTKQTYLQYFIYNVIPVVH